MTTQAFKKINTGDYTTDTIQSNTDQAISDVSSKAILNLSPLTGITITTGSVNKVAHKLGKKPQHWKVGNQTANANVWESTDQTDDKFLALNSSANVTVTLWVG